MTNKTAIQLADEIGELSDKMDAIIERADKDGDRLLLSRSEEAELDEMEVKLTMLKGKYKERQAYESALAERATKEAGRTVYKRSDTGNISTTFGVNVLSVAKTGRTSQVPVDPNHVFKRAVMTSDSASAGPSLVKSTHPDINNQSTENIGFLVELTYMGAANNTTYPYLDRDNRLTAQNKTETASLTEQAYVIDSKTVSFTNYYTYPVLHNNVLRDSALGMGGMENYIYRVAADDVRRQVANDVLNGTGGSNNMTGITSMTGTLALDWASATVTDFTLLTSTVKSLMDVNVNTGNLSVIMPPRLWQEFSDLEDTTGRPLSMPEWLRDLNIKFYVSQFMNKNQLIIGDLSQLNLFFWEQVELGLATATETLFGKDQVAIRCLWRGDLVSTQADHILVVDNILSET